ALHLGGAFLEPGEEAFERRRMASLMHQRKREKLVDRIGRFVAQSRHELLARTGPEDSGIELEGGYEVGLGECVPKERMSGSEAWALLRALHDLLPQRALARLGQVVELLFRQADHRR